MPWCSGRIGIVTGEGHKRMIRALRINGNPTDKAAWLRRSINAGKGNVRSSSSSILRDEETSQAGSGPQRIRITLGTLDGNHITTAFVCPKGRAGQNWSTQRNPVAAG